MNGQRLKILMLEHNPSFVRLMKRALSQAHAGGVSVVDVSSIEEAERQLKNEHFDVFVLDLLSSQTNGEPLAAFDHLHHLYPSVPIVVLSSDDNYELSLQAMRRGAQDYLIKDKVTGQLLVRSLRYAIERQHMLDVMRRLAMLDEVTGLYNRNGFLTLVNQQMQLSRRTERKFVMLLIDLELPPETSGKKGRKLKEHLLVRLADLLRNTFRSSDILAHIDETEFGVLAIDVAEGHRDNLVVRLNKAVLAWNLQNHDGHHLNLTIGATIFSGNERKRVEDLIAQARQTMQALPLSGE